LSNEDWKKVRWGFDGLVEGGINGLSKTQANHIMAGKDISMQIFADESTQGVAGKFTASDSEPAMQMIYSLLTGVNKNPEAFQAYLARNAAATQSLSANRDAQFEQSVQTALNRKNPRFGGVIPNEKDWRGTDFNTTYRAYRQAFDNANGMYFTFVGNGDTEHIKQLAERYLGSLPADMTKTNQTRDTGVRLDFSPRRIELLKGKEALAQVRLLFGGETPFDETDNLALQALAHALNIRLVERLREQEGGVYSPYAYAAMARTPYPQFGITVGFNCAPDNTEALITSTQDEIKQLLQNGIREQDLLKFKQAEISSYAKRTNTNEFWAAGIQQSHLNGTPLSRLVDYPKRINALTAEQVHAAAKKYLAEKGLVAILKPE
jgi:zinc protease